MIKLVLFHPMADLELNEAAAYYESSEIGLGDAFIIEVERVVKLISQNPESAPVILKSVLCKILWRFPYSLLYSIYGNTIRILAVANQKRRPFYWRSRK
jgi:hypothetical protein